MKLQATNHRYYCSDSNFYVGNHNGENWGRAEYESWQEFKDNWFMSNGEIDHDYNHCFRFDIENHTDEGGETIPNRFLLRLYMMHQRKGRFIPIHIKEIMESDMPEIKSYLKECWEYLCQQWVEVKHV